MGSYTPQRMLARLTKTQVHNPGIVLAAALALTIAAVAFASRLRMLTGFEYLLPQGRPSVVELNRVASKTAGVSTLFVVLRSETPTATTRQALRDAGDALVKELAKLGPPVIGSVEDGIHDGYRFLAPRAGLFADEAELRKLDHDLGARFEWEVAKEMGQLLDESDAPPPIDEADLRRRFGLASNGGAAGGIDPDRYPDGYYQSKDGSVLVVAIRSKVLASDFDKGSAALEQVKGVVARVDPARFDPSVTVGWAGDLYSGLAEYRAIMKDLTEVGYLGGFLIAAIVFLYYLRVRTLAVMVTTIAIGLAWTFGVTDVAIGHLNVATGFLFTIVGGNGINFGILYMARYLEARRRGESLEAGIATAHRETWVPTLTTALAASAAYASLVVTEFRGFRDFGMIGGYGMVLCWLATYWTLPSLLVLSEKWFPLESERGLLSRLRRASQGGLHFGRPFARLVSAAPRATAAVGLSLALLGAIAAVRYIRKDPMEYDLNRLRNDLQTRADEKRNKQLADEITGYVGSDAMAILVDRPEQVAPLRDVLYAKRDRAPAGKKPFDSLHALDDLVAKDQTAKIPILESIATKLNRARRRGAIDDAAWSKVERVLPPADLHPYTMADLPDDVARAFTEADGTRGRIVYISPTKDDSTEDAHYLLRWADSYRRTELPDGSIVIGSGRAVIYADMWEAVIDAVPKAVTLSFLATMVVVFLAFRGSKASLLVAGALLVGVAWLLGLGVLFGIKVNFLNFIALPITFGIGVDYSVNIVQRVVREGKRGAVLTALRETGGAVILCSLTTTLGYLALVRSMNFGVRSLGVAAVLGEVSCLLAAVLVLPGVLLTLDRRRAARASTTHQRPRSQEP